MPRGDGSTGGGWRQPVDVPPWHRDLQRHAHAGGRVVPPPRYPALTQHLWQGASTDAQLATASTVVGRSGSGAKEAMADPSPRANTRTPLTLCNIQGCQPRRPSSPRLHLFCHRQDRPLQDMNSTSWPQSHQPHVCQALRTLPAMATLTPHAILLVSMVTRRHGLSTPRVLAPHAPHATSLFKFASRPPPLRAALCYHPCPKPTTPRWGAHRACCPGRHSATKAPTSPDSLS